MSRNSADRLRKTLDASASAPVQLLCLLVLAFLLLATGPAAAAQMAKEKHEQAVAALKKLGATVKSYPLADGTSSLFVSCYGQSFGAKWKGTEAELKLLQGLTNLTTLYIEWQPLTDGGLEHLKGLTTLQELSVRNAKITDKGLAHLQGLTGLKVLRLGGTLITADGLGKFDLKNVEMLEVSSSRVAEIHLHKYRKLRTLYAGQVERIHAKDAGNVKDLSFFHASLTDAGLADIEHLTKLEKLSLIGCAKITDKGLAALKGLGSLKRLDLREMPGLTDAGLVHLKGLTKLEVLFLSDTKITDAGLVHLKNLQSLLRVELDHTQVTPQGVQKLKMALPKLVYP
jgi:Leucine-rich repeat (LRR) protein